MSVTERQLSIEVFAPVVLGWLALQRDGFKKVLDVKTLPSMKM